MLNSFVNSLSKKIEFKMSQNINKSVKIRKKMLLNFPETVWVKLIDYLDIVGLCKLREVNNSLRKKIDYDIFFIYKRFEGKQDTELSEYLNYKIIYPELGLNKVDVPRLNFINIGVTFQMMRHFDILDIVDHYDMFKFIIHKAQINELNTKKLIKAIKLVLLGLSEHYTLECMPLTNERIEWAISFKKAGLCDIFCWRGASEFNESQKNNLLKLIKHTNQDCFTFEAAQCLSDGQIDIMIEKKKENMLDYYAMISASEIDV